MKSFLTLLGVLISATVAHAFIVSTPSTTATTLTVPGNAFDITFNAAWTTDDHPVNSAAGRIELLDSGGTVIGTIVASVYLVGGPNVALSGPGTYDIAGWYANIFTPGGNPADAGISIVWHVTGLSPGTYTARMWNYSTRETTRPDSTVWTTTTFVSGTPVAPPNTAPSIYWTSAPGSAADWGSYYVAAHGNDADGNLSQVNIWKNGVPFAFAGGGNGFDGDSGNWSSDGGPQTVTFIAQSVDAAGVTSPVISFTIAISGPPPPVQYTLTTAAAAGGGVSSGGTYNTGTVITISATPDGAHDFAGWSGDASGFSNPLSVTIDRNKGIQANFSLKVFPLTTSATTGGGVTPGGSYPYGTVVTLNASPDAFSRFSGWTGDVVSASPSITVTMTAARSVQAVFIPKLTQAITFPNPGNRSTSAPPFNLGGTSSSGLTVSYSIVSGPAVLIANQLQVTGAGAIVVQATQPGDATYLSASPVSQTFNGVAPSIVKYQPAARTLLQAASAGGPTHLLLVKP